MNTAPLEPPFWLTLPDPCPKDTIAWALEAYPKLSMTSAFNLNGVVLIDLAAEAGYTGEVIFVDTGYHFAETLETRDALAKRYPQLHFVTLDAGLPLNDLYTTDPDACCAARKVTPLRQYLERTQPDALLNARSRTQADTRASIPILEYGERTKINPLAHWSQERLETHAKRFELPVNPLYWDGFLSIGCGPCTRAVRPGEDPRAGRWAGRGKTECGLWQGSGAL
ncbi:MAG: phosphoadenylyl-sulfate reductase [Pleurocapsa sp. SU_196_0]|nr:phosphoadenylyl-sulfate reductase [Pleurocapsa sp. SU_196_0]